MQPLGSLRYGLANIVPQDAILLSLFHIKDLSQLCYTVCLRLLRNYDEWPTNLLDNSFAAVLLRT